jgi:hypothetical protein
VQLPILCFSRGVHAYSCMLTASRPTSIAKH